MMINHDIATLNAYNIHSINQGHSTLSLRKLASGTKINNAGDNAALLAISEKMRSQTRGLTQSIGNADIGRNLVQTAEGALGRTHEALGRMRELAVQAANDTNLGYDRQQIQHEFNQLSQEINRISRDTEFNTMKLLNGDFQRTVGSDPGSVYGAKVSGNPNSEVRSGDYNIALSGASSADAKVVVSDYQNVVSGGSLRGSDVTVSNGASFGTYSLDVTQNGDGSFSGRLTAPDGKTSAMQTITPGGGNVSFGDISLNFSNTTALSAGKLDVKVTGDLNFSVTNKGTGETASYRVNGYDGRTADLGGIELTDVRVQADDPAGQDVRINASGSSLTLHVGANAGQNMRVSFADTSSAALGLSGADLTTQAGADKAIGLIDDAINRVSSERSRMGAVTNRIDHTIRSLSVAESNLTASESRIRDTDTALEILNYTRKNILAQASLSIMAQSRLMPQSILHLLQ